ncbi:hypothetical protein [Paenibacillus sp. WLX2291]|uniref:hypothetical protein n=1 Tax=Paenibacillus sp. WLX2291 TaxID=3296934 RepID=UPI0039844CAF
MRNMLNDTEQAHRANQSPEGQTRLCYIWTPEATIMNENDPTEDEWLDGLDEQQRIEQELEYLNSWDRVLEFL